MVATITPEELRTSLHEASDALVNGLIAAGTTVELSEEVKAALEAAGMKATPVAKINPAVAKQISAAVETLKMGIVQAKGVASERTPRADEDKDTFKNLLADIPKEQQAEVAHAHMLKLLAGVDSAKYKLFAYNPETGKMMASAHDPNKNMFVGIGERSGGWQTVGSLANRIKVIISGGAEEGRIIVAS